MSEFNRLTEILADHQLQDIGSPASDGFGPNSLGHRVPALRIPAKIAAQVARLTMDRPGASPLVPEEKLEALLQRLADRLAQARDDRDSGTGEIRFRWHAGVLREFRINPDDKI